MTQITEILATARERAAQMKLPYSGALTPQEAYLLMKEASPAAVLVDVRSHAEWDLTGTIPGSVQIEWKTYPGWHPNPHFLPALKSQVDPESLVMFICRTGGRSHQAAAAAMEAGFSNCYNVLEGFEGDLDKSVQQRGKLAGWKAAGLPWVQS